jgi:hypothetical protein
VTPGAALSSLVWPSTATGRGYLESAPGTPLLHLFDNAFIGPVVVVLALAALAFARRQQVVLLLWAATLWCVVLSWGAATRLSGSSPTFSWHAPAWYLAHAIPILRNVDWIRISIISDLLLAMLAAITLERATSALRAKGGTWRRPVGSAVTIGAGILVGIPLMVASSVPFAAFQRVTVPGVLRHLSKGTDGKPTTALIFPGGTWYAGTPLAWQALAGFPYRDYEGYAWRPQPGSPTATVSPPPGVLLYMTANAPTAPRSIVLTARQRTVIRSAFAATSVTQAVVVGGYAGSEQLTRVYNQIFGRGRRFGNGEIWNLP